MARGNQRIQNRDKRAKKDAQTKAANTMSGTEYQHAKENNAAIMREKQKKANERQAAQGAPANSQKK